ncbi:MAG TPA: FAD-dependent oxidoreductase [Actinocatenispora sp.]
MAVPRRVVVVGAGPAGLTAARALTTAGASVTVLERGTTPGGRSGVDELRVGDEVWRFDQGAEFVASFYKATRYLARQVGLGRQDLVRLPVDGRVVIDNRSYEMPATVRAMMRSPLLSARSKRHVMALGTRLATHAPDWRRLDAAADLDDTNAAAYFADTVGLDYVERILPVTMDALMLSPAARTSRVLGMAQFAAAPGSTLYCPRGGLATLWDAVAAALDVRYDTTVAALHPDGDTVRVETAGGDALTVDAVLVAGPPALAAALLPDGHPDRELATDAQSSPAVKLHLALAAPAPDRRPVAPAGAGRHALAGVAPLEGRDTGQVPDRRGGLEICAAPQLGAELLDEPDRAVRTMLLAEAERLLGTPLGDILGWSVVRHAEGVPLFTVGWLRRLRTRATGLPTRTGPDARILPVGDWLASPSLEGAVRNALRTCALVLRH